MQSRVVKSNYLVLRIQPVCNTRGKTELQNRRKKYLRGEIKQDRIL